MDEIITPTAEELQEEQQQLAEVKDDELRKQTVASLGLEDNDANKELIDKIVADKKESRSKLSKAIGQKIKLREKAKGTTPPAPTGDKPLDAETIRKQTADEVTQRLEQRDLDEMEYPDDIKAEIKSIARVKNISVRQAAKDPYITYMVETAVKAGKIDEATLPRTSRTTPAAKQGDGKIPQFDMSTEAGRKAFDEWKANKKEK